jgi:hypothetical protein
MIPLGGTGALNDAVARESGGHAHPALATGIGAVAVVLLLVVLTEWSLLRAYGGGRRPRLVGMLGAIVLPLLVVFAVAVGSRIVELQAAR